MLTTVSTILRLAYKDAGILADGGQLTSEQSLDGLTRLNDLVNFEVVKGVKLFLFEDVAIPLVAGKGTYLLGPTGDVVMAKPLQVTAGFYLDPTNVRRPLINYPRVDFALLAAPTLSGPTNGFFPDMQLSAVSVSFWPIPDLVTALGQIYLTIRRAPANFMTLLDASMFPAEWTLFLRWNLAYELSSGQPPAITRLCQKNAFYYREELESFDVETGDVRFTPGDRYGR